IRDEKNPSRLQVFVRVLNYRARPVEVTVELEARVGEGEGKLLDKQALGLNIRGRAYKRAEPDKNELGQDEPGEGATTFYLENVDETSEVVLHAQLSGWRDQFGLDDQAWLVCG